MRPFSRWNSSSVKTPSARSLPIFLSSSRCEPGGVAGGWAVAWAGFGVGTAMMPGALVSDIGSLISFRACSASSFFSPSNRRVPPPVVSIMTSDQTSPFLVTT